MSRVNGRLGWAVLLIGVGVLVLLQNFNIVARGEDLFFGFVMGAAGLAFLALYVSDRAKWWATIPGFLFVTLGAMLAMPFIEDVLALLIPAAIGLAFWLRYVRDRTQWWAIIVAGVLTAASVTALIDELNIRIVDEGGVFMLLLAATFGLVYLSPTGSDEKPRTWAAFAAAGSLVIGVIAIATTFAASGYFWAVALILAGLYLAFQPKLPGRKDSEAKGR